MKILWFFLLTFVAHAAPTIPNPSFEANAAFTVFPGYVSGNSAITGWTTNDPSRVGLNATPGLNVFADNGATPAGSQVAFIQSTGATTSLRTTLTGLVAGTTYDLSFRANARTNPTFPKGSYRINGGPVMTFFVRPVNGTAVYHSISDTFIATGSTAQLEISNTTEVDSTLLVDDFRIVAATKLTVTNTNDSGTGSLRAAIATAAASTTVFNTIQFAPALNGGTITLASELSVTDASGLAIDASTLSNGLTLNGGTGANRVLAVAGASTRLFLRRLTLTSGNLPSGSLGGAISSSNAALTLHQCHLSVNSSPEGGGAIYTFEGQLRLYQCTLSNNTAKDGGAIFNDGNLSYSTTTLSQCTLSGNRGTNAGGGIRNEDGLMYLSHCTITSNTAPTGSGAGVLSFADNFTETVVDRCIIAQNANSADVDLSSSGVNSFTSFGRNIIGVGEATADFSVNDLTGQAAQLLGLSALGGYTSTVAIGATSPALNAAGLTPITMDQRGRPLLGAADVGAFDLQAGSFRLSASAYRVREGEPVLIQIQRGFDVAGPVTVRLVTRPGTATAADFTARPITSSSDVTFPAVSGSQDISIPTTADFLVEGDHSFTVELSLVGVTDGSAILTSPVIATVTITDPILVTTTADDGPGSLRQAIRTAATRSGADAVIFSPTLSGQTITLGSEIGFADSDSLRIDASALPHGITLDGGPGLNRVLSFLGSGQVTLRCLNVTGGGGVGAEDGSNGQGGAIYRSGGGAPLNLERCTFYGNSAPNQGGAVYSGSTLQAAQCTFSGNICGGNGGAIHGPAINLFHCTFAGNSASAAGGGVLAQNTVMLDRCLFSGNTAVSGNTGSILTVGINRLGTSFAPDVTATVASGTGTINATPVLVAPLADNGGPTLTHALLPGSTPRDAGTGSGFTKDQRGVSIVDTPDVGAFEVDLGGVFAFSAKGYLANEGSAGTIVINRTGGFSDVYPVTLTVVPGTATSADHTLTTQTVTFADGEVSKTINFLVPGGDAAEPNESFTVKLSVSGPGTSLGPISTATVTLVDDAAVNDNTPPGVPVILSPRAGSDVNADVGGPITISGTVSDERGVRYVNVFSSGLAYLTTVTVDTPGAKTSTWSTTVTPVTGANLFHFRGLDASPSPENESALVSRSFHVLRPLLVSPSGFGTVTAGFAPKSFRGVGRPYSITATPGAGYLFAGWSILSGQSPSAIGTTLSAMQFPVLSFIHREGLVLRPTFVRSPYTPQLAGRYEGYVIPSGNVPPSLKQLGAISFNLLGTGAFSGTLRLDGSAVPFSGVLDASGSGRFGPNRLRLLTLLRTGKPAINMELGVDVETETFAGNVFLDDGTQLVEALLEGRRLPYSSTNPVPAQLLASGKVATYTGAILPGNNPNFTPDQIPQGYGFYTMKLSPTGVITVTGSLPDGTALTASSNLSGGWHLFAQLYSGNGLLFAYHGFNPTQFTDFEAAATWIRPVQDTQHYPSGWPAGLSMQIGTAKFTATNGTSVVAGLPSNGAAQLDFNEGLQIFDVTISPADISAGATGVTLKINRKTGVFSGSFQRSPGVQVPYRGIITNKDQTNSAFAAGYFLSPTPRVKDYTGQAGSVKLLR
jgi:predicted outer membrane repeat protein